MRKLFIASAVFFLFLLLGGIVFEKTFRYPTKVTYGVTFAPRYAKYLKLNWQKTYLDILNQLNVKNLRLPTYWDLVEPKEGKYEFGETDFMLKEAGKRGAQVILVVGMRQPRWPECQAPAWAKTLSLYQRRQKILELIQKVVERYKSDPAISAWQVENEPFLPFFGQGCDKADANFLKTEVNLIRSLSDKKIMVTDSGELGTWIVPMQISDIFGSTLYRDVYNPVLGYINYPVLPYFYNLHSFLVNKLFAPQNEKTIIAELQAEPWFSDGNLSSNFAQQAKLFPLSKMQSYIEYAKKTGFDTMYLWGVEWWYVMAANGYPEYLNYAKRLFQ